MLHHSNMLVSVIIPSYNSENYIKRAVSSVLGQTYDNLEIIVIRNGGRPLPYLGNSPKIRIIDLDENQGVSNARNIGIQEARGEYIALLDADDYWDKEKLELQMRVIRKYTRADMAPGICFTGRRLYYETDGHIKKGKYVGCEKTVTYHDLLKTNQINCSSVVIRKDLALKHPFPDGKKMHEDYAVWLDILREGEYALGINRPLLLYRVSPGSKSGNKFRSAVMTYNVYRYVGLSVIESLIHMMTYTFYGVKKYI